MSASGSKLMSIDTCDQVYLLLRQVSTLYLTHADRLVRFGHELIYQVCRWAGTDVVLLEAAEPISFDYVGPSPDYLNALTQVTAFQAYLLKTNHSPGTVR